MATNINVERMSVSADSPSDTALPDMPEIPMHIRAKNPLWQEYHEQQQLWWQAVKPYLENLALAAKRSTE